MPDILIFLAGMFVGICTFISGIFFWLAHKE